MRIVSGCYMLLGLLRASAACRIAFHSSGFVQVRHSRPPRLHHHSYHYMLIHHHHHINTQRALISSSSITQRHHRRTSTRMSAAATEEAKLTNYVDVHCHIIHEKFAGEEDAVAQRARDKGLEFCVVNGLEPQSNRAVLELCERHPNSLLPALGK